MTPQAFGVLLAAVFALLTFLLGGLCGAIFGYWKGAPSSAELDRLEQEQEGAENIAYDLGYADGYEHAASDDEHGETVQ